jgi:hypothetical protein
MARVWRRVGDKADRDGARPQPAKVHWRRRTIGAAGVAVVALLLASCSNGTPSASSSSSTTTAAAPAPSTTTPTLGATTTTAPRPTQVAVFGDSLSWEVQPYYDQLIRADKDVPHTYDTFGGTAICDWLTRMREVEAQYHPQVVELEFSGNNLTPCMKNLELYTSGYYDQYRADTLSAIDIFVPGGAHVYLIGAPITKKQSEGVPTWERLNQQYAAIAATDPQHVTYVPAGSAVEGPDGTFTTTLPCLPGQPCTGPTVNGVPSNVVRSTDGTHFCPTKEGDVHGVVERCGVYSSGAYRFASAMVNAVVPKSNS